MSARSQRLYGRIAAADPHDSKVGYYPEQAVDDRFEHSRQKADSESVDGPQRTDELKSPRIRSTDCEKHGNERPDQRDGSDHQAYEAEWFFGPAVSAL
jgi:hypothetical protein